MVIRVIRVIRVIKRVNIISREQSGLVGLAGLVGLVELPSMACARTSYTNTATNTKAVFLPNTYQRERDTHTKRERESIYI